MLCISWWFHGLYFTICLWALAHIMLSSRLANDPLIKHYLRCSVHNVFIYFLIKLSIYTSCHIISGIPHISGIRTTLWITTIIVSMFPQKPYRKRAQWSHYSGATILFVTWRQFTDWAVKLDCTDMCVSTKSIENKMEGLQD